MKFEIKINTHKVITSALAHFDENATLYENSAFVNSLYNFFPLRYVELEFDTETKTATIVE